MSETSSKKPKRKRTIKPRQSTNAEAMSWSSVNAQDWLDFCDIACTQGISVTPSSRRDQQALAVRFWHPDYELETVYFGVDEHGENLPETVWEYLAQIVAEVNEKTWEEVYDQLRKP